MTHDPSAPGTLVERWVFTFIGAALACAAVAVHAQDRADLDRTQVIGNRELPKVLYIAPWKKPIPGDLSGRPLQSVLDEALVPVDRDVFRRSVQYDTQVRSAARIAAAATPPAAATAASPVPTVAAQAATAAPAR